jgi:hypothetical protein
MPRSLGPGALAVVLAACTIAPPATTPQGEPTAQPPATATPSPADSFDAGDPGPTPLPTVLATTAPSPTPDLSAMDLEAIGCPGGVVLHWTASAHPEFHHYVALRSPEFEIDTAYPPIAPAVDWGDTYATDPFVTSAVDASILPSSTLWFYRVMAYDVDGTVLGATPVRGGRIAPVDALGPVAAAPSGDGGTRLSWGPYRGRAACFTAYRVLYGTGGTASTLLATVSDPAQAELVTDALAAGVTYTIRVEAVRVTTLGTFVTGRTEPATLTLP